MLTKKEVDKLIAEIEDVFVRNDIKEMVDTKTGRLNLPLYLSLLIRKYSKPGIKIAEIEDVD